MPCVLSFLLRLCDIKFHFLIQIVCLQLHFFKHFYLVKLADLSRGQPKDSLFNSYYTKVLERALLLSLDCSTLPLIRTL